MHWPQRQYATARPARLSPVHERLGGAGRLLCRAGRLGAAGLVRRARARGPQYDYSYGRTAWFERWAAEHRAVRAGAGLLDLSSFGKFLLQGRDAEAVLQRVSAGDVAVEPGRVVYTQWLNERGGIEADLTITRLAADRFMITTGAASQARDLHWLLRHIPDGAHAFVTDVTSGLAVLALMGPQSRELLARITTADLSNAAFPFGERPGDRARLRAGAGAADLLCRRARLRALHRRASSPARSSICSLVRIGEDLSLAGFHALNSLRLEKAFRHFGHDIGDEDTPFEAGLGFAVALDKPGGFIGRDALLRAAETRRRPNAWSSSGSRTRDPLLHHDEPIVMDGHRIGLLTSGSYGHTLGAALGMGWVRHPDGVTAELCWLRRASRSRSPASATRRWPASARSSTRAGARMRA